MDTQVATTVIDISPLLNSLIELAGVALLTVATWAAHKYGKKLGIEQDSKVREYLDDAIAKGIAFGEAKLKEQAGKIDEIDIKNAKIAEAANYVTKGVPDALKRFKIDDERLKQLIIARLGE